MASGAIGKIDGASLADLVGVWDESRGDEISLRL